MEKLSKIKIQNIYKKCLNLVKKKPAEFFNFKKMRGSEGLCNWTDIEIDYRRELLSTAYHECVHYLYPNYSESMVRYIEKRLVNVCSELDMAYFLKLLSSKLYKSELQKHIIKSKKTLKKGKI
jgi:hypothetical protein